MAPRQFTREEAEEMLPYLAPLLFKLRGLKTEHDGVQAKVNEISGRMRTNGHGLADDLRFAQAELVKTADQINGLVERVNEMGCELKDVDMGLVDFRSIMEGRQVYLCWRLGEEHVAYWHEMDTGFAGRQPLEDPGD
jgi:hypothetical protein